MKSNRHTARSIAGVLLIGLTGVVNPSNAHIVLEQKTAAAGSYYRAAFRVGHGCDGSATRAVTVRLASGIRNAKPAPKAGWLIERTIEKLATPMTLHGKTITENVTEITWRGGLLADEHFDEFVMQMQLPETPGPVWFKVLQQCEKGQTDWAELPAQGTSTQGMKHPAALLNVIAPADADSVPKAEKADSAHKH
jgi:periplasmic copper chaperone A